MKQELLRKMQLEAGGSHYPDINPKMQERFAELIVRECANIAAERGGLDIYEEIREHFGVKE
jgi:hypothetical protein